MDLDPRLPLGGAKSLPLLSSDRLAKPAPGRVTLEWRDHSGRPLSDNHYVTCPNSVRIRSNNASLPVRTGPETVNGIRMCRDAPTPQNCLRGWRSQERGGSNPPFRTNTPTMLTKPSSLTLISKNDWPKPRLMAVPAKNPTTKVKTLIRRHLRACLDRQAYRSTEHALTGSPA